MEGGLEGVAKATDGETTRDTDGKAKRACANQECTGSRNANAQGAVVFRHVSDVSLSVITPAWGRWPLP